MSRESREARHHEKVLAFAACEFCSHDLATGEGERACHYFECPYVPEELVVICPTCQHNFFTGDGPAQCANGKTCDFAREAPQRVATLREWLSRHGRDAVTGAPLG